MADEEDKSDTPRVCEACGDASEVECHWCTNGFQSEAQQKAWRHFRKRVTKVSGTYQMAQRMIEDIIEVLDEKSEPETARLAEEGRILLQKWVDADPVTAERTSATSDMKEFHRRVLDFLFPKK